MALVGAAFELSQVAEAAIGDVQVGSRNVLAKHGQQSRHQLGFVDVSVRIGGHADEKAGR